MGGLLHLVQREGTGQGRSPLRTLIAVPTVTAHQSTARVPITVLLYNGPLLCGFNVSIKGLRQKTLLSVVVCFLFIAKSYHNTVPTFIAVLNQFLVDVLLLSVFQDVEETHIDSVRFSCSMTMLSNVSAASTGRSVSY